LPLPDDAKEKLVRMLALVYASVPWGRMRTRHRAPDIWNHRVRAATGGNVLTVSAYLSRLCNFLGLQSAPPEAVALALSLEPLAEDVLEAVRAEHIPIAVRSRLIARAPQQEGENDADHGG